MNKQIKPGRPTDSNSLANIAKSLTKKLGFKVTIKCVRCWREKGYPLDDPKGLLECLRGQHRSPIPVPKTLTEARIKKLQVEIEAAEFRLARERGEYTHNDDVREQGTWLAARINDEMARFVSDAPTWAGLLPEEIERRVRQIINDIRKVFHNFPKERAGK